MRIRVGTGAALAALGIAARIGLVAPLVDYVYPLLWWGVLLILDAWNAKRRGLTLWSGHSAAVLAPVSVIYWLYFEALNLASPQWRYVGGLQSVALQTVYGFVAFATVIPVAVEFWWLVGGPVCLPFRRPPAAAALVVAALLTAIPVINHGAFWWNQGMWVAPALAALPFVSVRLCGSATRYLMRLAVAALLMGLAWEGFNYGARTHWEYLILPNAPHLFQMPAPGYLGFIPFMAGSHVVYEWQRSLPAKPGFVFAWYAAALVGLWVLTERYLAVGLWRIVR